MQKTAAGNLLSVTGKTVIRMVEKGEIAGYRVGNIWRFKRIDIEVYLEAHRYRLDQRSDDWYLKAILIILSSNISKSPP